MPLSNDPGVSGSEKYCSYCFKNGELCYKGDDVGEFKRISYTKMREKGMNFFVAKFFTWIIGFAPRWKK